MPELTVAERREKALRTFTGKPELDENAAISMWEDYCKKAGLLEAPKKAKSKK